MTTPEEAKAIGDAWGVPAGLFVDAALSHHASHCCEDKDAVIAQKRDDGRHDPTGELAAVTVTEKLGCEPSWTDTKGAVKVMYYAPGAMGLAGVATHYVKAGSAMDLAVTDAVASPSQVAPGANEIIVAVDQSSEPGLYVGKLQAAASTGGPTADVLIYLDNVV